MSLFRGPGEPPWCLALFAAGAAVAVGLLILVLIVEYGL